MEALRLVDEHGIVAFYDAFTRSDFATMSRMLHPDCELEFPGSSFPNRVAGRDAIVALFQGVQAGFGGTLAFHPRWAMFQRDLTAVHWYTTGRLATGGLYLNRGVAWYRLEDGLVREFLDFFDTEIVAACFPGGAPATDFAQADALVARLRALAPPAALARLDALAGR